MRLTKMHWFGIIFGLITLLLNLIFFLRKEDINLFFFIGGIAICIMSLPFVISIALENRREQEMAEMFLEFSRSLAESVTTGTPISKSIINMSKKNYRSLTPYVRKLGNQIYIGIPVEQAFRNFATEVNNPVISRAVTLISEAEKAGGEIDYILESVAKSIAEVEKLKKERKAAVYNLVVQGYIIFFIFIGIMLVMKFKIIPLTSGISSFGTFGGTSVSSLTSSTPSLTQPPSQTDISSSFLYLLITQGLFAGLTIGKLTEGSLKAGIKHSFILTITAVLILSGASLLIKSPV